MRAGLLVLLISVAFFLIGCAAHPPAEVAGDWQGYITERDESTLVGISIQSAPAGLLGTFTILSDTPDMPKGTSFEIVQLARSGDTISFVVPLTDKVDWDSMAFTLTVRDDQLTGSAHELMSGAADIPVKFTRQAR